MGQQDTWVEPESPNRFHGPGSLCIFPQLQHQLPKGWYEIICNRLLWFPNTQHRLTAINCYMNKEPNALLLVIGWKKTIFRKELVVTASCPGNSTLDFILCLTHWVEFLLVLLRLWSLSVSLFTCHKMKLSDFCKVLSLCMYGVLLQLLSKSASHIFLSPIV